MNLFIHLSNKLLKHSISRRWSQRISMTMPCCLGTSIDVLELIVLLEKQYGIELESPAEAKKIFASVRTMAEYVMQNRKK